MSDSPDIHLPFCLSIFYSTLIIETALISVTTYLTQCQEKEEGPKESKVISLIQTWLPEVSRE